MRPVLDIVEVLETPKTEGKLKKHYYHTKQLVQGRANKGVIRGRTNNPKSRDGMRSGAIIFNEVHIYENYLNIKVFMSSLGKKEQPRVGIFTSNGDVSDGPLDDYINNGMRILFEGEPDNGFLPFICRLGNEKKCMTRRTGRRPTRRLCTCRRCSAKRRRSMRTGSSTPNATAIFDKAHGDPQGL